MAATGRVDAEPEHRAKLVRVYSSNDCKNCGDDAVTGGYECDDPVTLEEIVFPAYKNSISNTCYDDDTVGTLIHEDGRDARDPLTRDLWTLETQRGEEEVELEFSSNSFASAIALRRAAPDPDAEPAERRRVEDLIKVHSDNGVSHATVWNTGQYDDLDLGGLRTVAIAYFKKFPNDNVERKTRNEKLETLQRLAVSEAQRVKEMRDSGIWERAERAEHAEAAWVLQDLAKRAGDLGRPSEPERAAAEAERVEAERAAVKAERVEADRVEAERVEAERAANEDALDVIGKLLMLPIPVGVLRTSSDVDRFISDVANFTLNI